LVTTFLSSFFTFLRAVPTPVWVLLALVCLGLGPIAGIVGLSVHATAFFARAFSQSFEDVPPEVIEALEVTGASKLQIFFSAILPAALSMIIAWTGMRFEINFQESAILGMVGAGELVLPLPPLYRVSIRCSRLAFLLVLVSRYAIEIFIHYDQEKIHPVNRLTEQKTTFSIMAKAMPRKFRNWISPFAKISCKNHQGTSSPW
jgi:phosphonate transport system permease protein